MLGRSGPLNTQQGAASGAPAALSALDALWLAIAAAYPFVVLNFATLQVDEGDLWWSLALGRAAWQAGALPTTEPLAYTPTPGAYVQGQWLADLLLYGTYLLSGPEGLLVLRAAIVAIVFALLYVGCRRAGAAPTLAGLCTLLALPLVNVGLALRPQLFALVPFMLYLEATRRPASAGRRLYLLPLAMVVWANAHGSFLLGLGLVGLAGLGRLIDLARARAWRLVLTDPELRRLGVLLVLSALAPLVSPHGPRGLEYLHSLLAVAPGHRQLGGLLTEWLPTSLGTPAGPAFFVSLVTLVLLLYLNGLRGGAETRAAWWCSPAEGLRLLAFAWLALRWIRAIVWWGLVLPAPLAGLAQRALGGTSAAAAAPARPAMNRALLALVALVAVGSLPWWRQALPGLTPDARAALEPSPLVQAVDVILPDEQVGHVFHYVAWGGYLAWRLGPRPRIFVDGRYEAYQPQVFEDYARISQGDPDWDARLTAYGVGQLVLSRGGQAGLVEAVERALGWRRVYENGDVVVYRRAT